jgi:hypothetical protein
MTHVDLTKIKITCLCVTGYWAVDIFAWLKFIHWMSINAFVRRIKESKNAVI